MRILGIDPGINGGFFLLEDGNPKDMHIMPIVKECTGFVKRKGRFKYDKDGNKILKYKTEVDSKRVASLLSEWRPDFVYIEKVHAFAKQGVTSMFSFGCSYGILRGAVAWLPCQVFLVEPKAWQTEMFGPNANKDNTKTLSVKVATGMWPGLDFRKSARSRKAHDGICDAACMASYGLRLLSEGNRPKDDEKHNG
jgi:crossover junction endodeoxyribonuclease RuvC